jgi:hypothetical protein
MATRILQNLSTDCNLIGPLPQLRGWLDRRRLDLARHP